MSNRRGAHWPWLVTAALAFTVGVNVVMLFAANSDRNGSVVEPDYYRKAVAWDSTMARRAASDRLGWTASAEVRRSGAAVSAADSSTAGAVFVRLVDRAGAPVSEARVTAVLIHNVDAGNPLQLTLREREAGVYEGGAPIAHPGRWEVRVQARRGEEHFTAILIVDASLTASP